MVSEKHAYISTNCDACLACIRSCSLSNSNDSRSPLQYLFKNQNIEDIFEELYPQLLLLKDNGGITISGGEPLLQNTSVEHLLKLCKQKKINTAIETTGYIDTSKIKNLYKYVDFWLLGIHPFLSSNLSISSTINNFVFYLNSKDANITIRYPIIPGITNTLVAINKQIEFMKENLLTNIEILPYNTNTDHYYNALGNKCPFTNEEVLALDDMEKICYLFKNNSINTKYNP